VVPFFPLSPGEQAVVAHKFLLGNAAKARKDIDLRPEVKRHMGHCHISFQNDSDICNHMAKRGYRPSSGARRLKREAKKVEEVARKVYNAIEGPVTEDMNEGPLENLDVKLIKKGNSRQEVGVFRKLGGGERTQKSAHNGLRSSESY
jgi:ATP-dependent Clp protease ATP-binding subunit ClpA